MKLTSDEFRNAIAFSKNRLDELRPVSQAALRALQKSFDVDLTYTSNAIEGNTLTLRETAELIEHGLTVALDAIWHNAPMRIALKETR